MAPNVRLNVTLFLALAAAAVGLSGWAMSGVAFETPPARPDAPAADEVPKSADVPRAASEAPAPAAETPPAKDSEKGEHPVPPPPLSEGIFPCTSCHNADLPANPRRRTLHMAHKDIQLHHDEENRWCLDCHNADNRDVLRSASGAPIPFAESYRLCGQCHGDKYRDWKVGVHGKRTGEWNGEKHYLLCVHCHNPHSPKYKPIQPMPSPEPPRRSP